VSLLAVGPDFFSSTKGQSGRFVNFSLEAIDMLIQSHILPLQHFSFILQVKDDILLVGVQRKLLTLFPDLEGFLNLPCVHANNQLLKVQLLADFTAIELILPPEEVAGYLSVDHSADDIFSSRSDLVVHGVLA